MVAAGATGRTSRERGLFSLVEVLLAMLVLALCATATAYWVETVNNLSADADEQTIGLALVKAVEGMTRHLPFREPGSDHFGPEQGERLADYDDLDDFHLLTSSPPLDAARDPQASLTAWTVEMRVEPVNAATLAVVSASDLRRVRVRVEHAGRPVADAWWLRARAPLE